MKDKSAIASTEQESQEQNDNELDFLGSIGGIELPDIDINLFNFLPSDEVEETRYILPSVVRYASEDFVMYDNAVKLAKDLKVTEGMRADAFISGNFIFGDFVEAFLTEHHVCAKRMVLSTLSLSQNNVDSLKALMEHGYIEKLDIIISVYFWGNERHSLIPYIYKNLDKDDRFQMAVAGIHTKTCHFETKGGKKICIHGSANLRSSGNIEQFTIEENAKLFEFYDENFNKIIDKYATIRKPIRNKNAWDVFTKKYFKD